MISNTQDFIFLSDAMYPPVKASGSTTVASGDFGVKILTSGVTIDQDYAVYEERVLGSDGATIIGRALNPYVDPSGNLVYFPPFTPCVLHWRVYGY